MTWYHNKQIFVSNTIIYKLNYRTTLMAYQLNLNRTLPLVTA